MVNTVICLHIKGGLISVPSLLIFQQVLIIFVKKCLKKTMFFKATNCALLLFRDAGHGPVFSGGFRGIMILTCYIPHCQSCVHQPGFGTWKDSRNSCRTGTFKAENRSGNKHSSDFGSAFLRKQLLRYL